MTEVRKSISSLLIIFLAFIAAGDAPAQSGRKLPSTTQQSKDDTIRLRTEEVLLNITVTDSFNRQVTSLGRDEFIVSEDGQRQDISSFAISSVPVNVVLMLDASGSVAGEISSLRDAALSFVKQLGPEDKVSVLEFHSDVELLQDWTANADDIRHAISWRFKPGMVRTKEGHSTYGSTSLYDSLFLTAEEQLSKVSGRKAVIILTDGDDSSSKVTYDQALAAIIRSNAVVYVVSKARAFISRINSQIGGKAGRVLNGGNSRLADQFIARLERAERVMSDLAGKTGGQVFSPLKDSEMTDVYSKVALELKNQYLITYIPKNEGRDGRLRKVKVFLTRGGYTVRTRDSYYAPRD